MAAEGQPPATLLQLALSQLTFFRALGLAVAFFCLSFVADCLSMPAYPASIARVSRAGKVTASGGLRSVIASLWNFTQLPWRFRDWILEGYAKYNKHGSPFVAAALPSRPAEVVLPSSLSGWLLEQPDSVASVWHAHDDQLHGKYLFLGPRTLGDPFHVRVVHRHLARHLPGKLADMSEEVAIAVDKVFGEAGKAPAGGGDAGDASDGPWTEYNIWHSLLAVVPRVMNRMLLGLPLCRDERLLNAFMEFADHVIPCSMLLDMTPAILHPLMGRFLGLKSWECWRRVRDLSLSIIQPRVDRMLAEEEARAKAKGDEKQPRNRPPPPEDFITWSVRTALAEGNDFELDPEQISKRLMPINFAGIHTTVLVLHAFLLNLASSDPAEDVIGQLRREIASVLAESPELYPMAPPTPTSGSAKPLPISSANSTRPSHAAAFAPRWTKAALSRLHLLDSALRESLRFSSFNLTGVERKIVAPEGLTLPESAFLTSKPPPSARDRTIPFGSLVSFNIAGVHLDPAVVPSGTSSESSKENGKKMRTKGPDEFDAFRFARERARLEAMTPEDEAALGWATGDATLKALRLSMTTTSESYLPFGHGRHACPGRFFAAYEIKMIIAYLLMNYDIRHMPERPKTRWIGRYIIPRVDVKIGLRRRKVPVDGWLH